MMFSQAGAGLDLFMHRIRVGHGIPGIAAPLASAFYRMNRDRFEARERRRVVEEAKAVRERYEGKQLELEVGRWPKGFTRAKQMVEVPTRAVVGGVQFSSARADADTLAEMATYLRTRGLADLRAIPVRRILDVLDRSALTWLDPSYEPRRVAIEAIHRATGFSREMVIHSMDLEMRSSRKADLWRTIVAELGNPMVLDRRAFAPSGEAPSAAFGPALLAAVFSSNIPALPHLSYMRGLAVKSPVLGKAATDEPLFAGQYVQTLVDLCPEMATGLAAVWFPGGSVEEELAMLRDAEHVIAYGSDRSLHDLCKRIPAYAGRTLHAHRMGVGIVATDLTAEQEVERVAAGIAYDVAVFDGQACLAPMVYFVEGSLDQVVDLAGSIGRQLDSLASWLPRRQLSLGDAAARRKQVDGWEVASHFGGQARSVMRESDAEGIAWAGLITEGEYTPQRAGDRLFHLHRVERVEEVVEHVQPFHKHLQNVALEADAPRRAALAERLSALGATRVTRPGLMPTPSMMWHHDGRVCLADLVRWSDIS